MTKLESVRIDKWLWAARFFKTRSLATHAVELGRVRLNEARVKPARSVRPGDVLDIDNGSVEWQVQVIGLAEVRGSATVAQTLYRETEESIAKRQAQAEQHRYYQEPSAALKGRPTKQARRQMNKSGF